MTRPDATSSPLLVHAAFTALGLAAFALSNALWAEMSALYRRLPEGERLAAYMIVALQLANVLPAYLMITTRTHASLHPPPPAQTRALLGVRWWWGLEGAIVVLLATGLGLCLLLACMWDHTARLGGEEHAVRLFVLTFLVGCVNNSSGLALYPYVARWPMEYTSALATGEGLAGVLVALIAAAQNAGGARLRWGVGAYFVIVGLVIYSSASLGFFYLLRHPPPCPPPSLPRKDPDYPPPLPQSPPSPFPPAPQPASSLTQPDQPPIEVEVGMSTWQVCGRIVRPLRVQFVLSALSFGAVPALVPQACQAYQHQARILQYSSALSMSMDPVSRALTHKFHNYTLHAQLLAVVGCACVLLCCAALGPSAPFASYEWGGLIVILANGTFTTLFAFASTMVYLSIRHELDPPFPPLADDDDDTEDALNTTPLLVLEGEGAARLRARRQREAQEGYKWSAFTIQAGAFTGSIAVFIFTLAR